MQIGPGVNCITPGPTKPDRAGNLKYEKPRDTPKRADAHAMSLPHRQVRLLTLTVTAKYSPERPKRVKTLGGRG